MKIDERTKTHQTNHQGESYSFGISSEDDGQIINILRSKIYSHPIRTLVQEYICNARDALREAGKKDHEMVITAPTKENPIFSVRDYGCGISHDRMVNVFIKFGSSTKRDSNNQTGGFGVGSKSAFAYTQTFNVITRIEGKKRLYCCHIGSSNKGTLEFISEIDTSEADGTEIMLAVKSEDFEKFQLAVQRCVYFWSERPTIQGLRPLDWFSDESILFQKDEVTVIKDFNNEYGALWRSYGELLIVDGIPYDGGDYSMTGLIKNARICIHCNTGDVEVSASRENLHDSNENREKINKILKTGISKLLQMRIDDIISSETPKDFIKKISFWHKYSTKNEAYTKFGLTFNQAGILSSDDASMSQATKWRLMKQNSKLLLRTFNDSFCVTVEDLNSGKIVLMDEDISQAMKNNKIKQIIDENAVVIGFVKLFGGLESLRYRKLSEISIPKKPRAPRTKSTLKVFNFKIFDGHRFLDNNMSSQDFHKNADKYLYVDSKESALTLDSYFRLCKLTNRKVLGVNKQVLAVIEKLRKSDKNKYFTFDDLIDNLTDEIGSNYSALLQAARSTVFSQSQFGFLANFLAIDCLDDYLQKLDDPDLREKIRLCLKNRSFISRNYHHCYPKKAIDKLIAQEPSIQLEMLEAQSLSKFLYDVIPFFRSGYDWSEKEISQLMKAINLLSKEVGKS